MATKNMKKALRLLDAGADHDEVMNKTPFSYMKAIAYKKQKVLSKARSTLFIKLYQELRDQGHGRKEAKEMAKAELKGAYEAKLGDAGQNQV